MKDTKEDCGATAFFLPNDQKPKDYNDIHYGPDYVPHPTNHKAKMAHPDKVMKAVLKGK